MECELECNECGWSGNSDELRCSDEEFNDKSKSYIECKFNICPECGAVDQFKELDNEPS